jgi:hypothetical protein
MFELGANYKFELSSKPLLFFSPLLRIERFFLKKKKKKKKNKQTRKLYVQTEIRMIPGIRYPLNSVKYIFLTSLRLEKRTLMPSRDSAIETTLFQAAVTQQHVKRNPNFLVKSNSRLESIV